jgi:hypothetical protein
MSATIADALKVLTPTAEYTVLNNTYAGITWYSPDIEQPTEQQVLAQQAAMDAQAPLDACKQQASQLLYETDWTTIADVADPAKSNPYLMNPSDFTAYRSALRVLAVYPVANPVWPTKPTEQWSPNP